MSIAIVGTGPGPLALVTEAARQVLLGADRVLCRVSDHPVHDWLRAQGARLFPLDFVYDIPRISYAHVYGLIADIVIREARIRGRAVYALPGHPLVFETTTQLIVERAASDGIDVRIVPGISFLEQLYAELHVDPASGLQIASAFDFEGDASYLPAVGLVIAQLFAAAEPGGARSDALIVAVERWLAARYAPDHPVSIVWSTGAPGYDTRSRTFPRADFLRECARIGASTSAASAYIPGTKK